MSPRTTPPKYLVCVSNRGHKVALTVDKLYRTLPDATAARHGLVRVIDESGEDYLFPRALFAAVDARGNPRSRIAT